MHTNKKKDVSRLRDYNHRLRAVVSELLSKINDLEQERSFRPTGEREFSQIISQTCQQLVTLGDALTLVEHLLDQGRVEESRHNILVSCTAADAISHRIDHLQQQLQGHFKERLD